MVCYLEHSTIPTHLSQWMMAGNECGFNFDQAEIIEGPLNPPDENNNS